VFPNVLLVAKEVSPYTYIIAESSLERGKTDVPVPSIAFSSKRLAEPFNLITILLPEDPLELSLVEKTKFKSV
jgi:hypothetical protein